MLIGLSQYVYPYYTPVRWYEGQPNRPEKLTVAVASAYALLVTWNKPTYIRSISIDHYEVEYDANSVFVTDCVGICSSPNSVTHINHLTVPGNSASVVLVDLIPGQDYFVRVRACYFTSFGDSLCSPWTFYGYPNSPISTRPMQAPGFVNQAAISRINSSSVAMDWLPPIRRAQGAFGAPFDSFTLIFSTPVDEVQQLALIDNTGTFNGYFVISLGSVSTRCIPMAATAATIELYVEELLGVDSVQVQNVSWSKTRRTYNVTFDGPILSNGNVPSMTSASSSSCPVPTNATTAVAISTIVQGQAAYVPEIISISTSTVGLTQYSLSTRSVLTQ